MSSYPVNPAALLAAQSSTPVTSVAGLILRAGQENGGTALLDGKVVSYSASTGLAIVTVRGVAVPDIPNATGLTLQTNDVVLLADYGPSYVVVGCVQAAIRMGETPYGIGYRTTALSIATGTQALLSPDDSQTLRGGMTYNAGAFIVPRDGVYALSGAALFVANSTGYRQIRVTTPAATMYGYAGANADFASPQVSGTAYMVAGQAVTFTVRQQSGISLALNVGTTGANYATVAWIGY